MKAPTTGERPEYKTALNQCYLLANLIEHAPSTYADESPLADWSEKIQHAASELIKTFGRFDSISTIIKSFMELEKRVPEAREVIKAAGWNPKDSEKVNIWHTVLDYAQNSKEREQRQIEHARHVAVQLNASHEEYRKLEAMLQEEREAHKQEIERLAKDAASRGPRRWKTIEVPDAT